MSLIDNFSSFTATILRAGRGIFPAGGISKRKQPKKLLELFDFEACPYCRRVREVLCELDLDYLERPVAKGSPRRQQLQDLGGKVQAPFLLDPNTGAQLYESSEIIAYLNDTYGGDQRAGWPLPIPGLLDNLSSALASGVRLGRGSTYSGRKRAASLKPITIYNMEGSPYCRKVREVLCELDLESIVRNVPKGSPKRALLSKLGGKMQVPYMVDPNSGSAMYESDEIVAYLEERYK